MTLSKDHRRELETLSGITAGLIQQRGYQTISNPETLTALGFSPEQAKYAPGLLIPIFSVDGEPVLHQFKPVIPRVVDGKPVKYETPAGSKMRLDIHPAVKKDLLDVDKPLCITEGIKKVDCLIARGHATVGLLGVWNFSGAGDQGGICELSDWDAIPFKTKTQSRTVYIIFDSDIVDKPGVKAAAIKLAAMCRRRGATVYAIRIPSKDGSKVGVDDFFYKGGTSDQLFAAVDDTLLRNDMVRVDGRSIADVAADAMAALGKYNDPPTIFVRAGEIVSIRRDERNKARVVPLNQAALRGILGRATSWCTVRAGKVVECFCPVDVASDIASLGEWPELPPLAAITAGPVLTPSSIAQSPGYNAESQMWLDCRPIVDFTGDSRAAVQFLRREILGSFPFSTDADFAHALCLMLLPIVRPIIDGPTPLHLIGAPVQKTGKTLLAKVCLMPTQGDDIAITPITQNEEELKKTITSVLRDGMGYLLMDNLTHYLDSASFSAMLTSGYWTDRRLGQTSMDHYRVNQVLVMTANNPNVGKDTVVRSIRIWLDAQVEHPEDRNGFKPVERYIRQNRPVIQGALCAIAQGWLNDQMPRYTETRLGSYEDWAEVMGGILLSCGVPGFLQNISELRDTAGSSEGAWAGFYERWFAKHGGAPQRVGDMLELFLADDDLSALLGDYGDSSRRIRFGNLVKSRVGVVSGGYVIERGEKKLGGSAVYRMVPNAERINIKRLLDVESQEPAGNGRVVRV